MRRHRHYSARAVAHKHIIGNKNRYFCVVNGIYGVNAVDYYPRFVLLYLGALEIGLFSRRLAVGAHLVYVLYFVRPFFNKGMLGRHYHVGYAEKGIGASGEDRHLIALGRIEIDLCALRSAYPIYLLGFYSGKEIDLFKIVNKSLCVSRYFEHPLALFFSYDLASATLAHAVYHFFVGKHAFT